MNPTKEELDKAIEHIVLHAVADVVTPPTNQTEKS